MFTKLSKMSYPVADAQLLEGLLADSSDCFSKLRLKTIVRVSLGQEAHQPDGYP